MPYVPSILLEPDREGKERPKIQSKQHFSRSLAGAWPPPPHGMIREYRCLIVPDVPKGC